MDVLQDMRVTSNSHSSLQHLGETATIEDPEEELKEYQKHKINNTNSNMDNHRTGDKIITLIDLEIAATSKRHEISLLPLTIVATTTAAAATIEIIAVASTLHRLTHLGNHIRTLAMIQRFLLMVLILMAILLRLLLQQLQHLQQLQQQQQQQIQITCILHSIVNNTRSSTAVLLRHTSIKLILVLVVSLPAVDQVIACNNSQ